MNYEELQKLDELRKSGAITEEEYQREKSRLLGQNYLPTEKQYWGMSEKSYIALMHISQLGGYVLPFLGFILPIVMWMINKDQNAAIDKHGKNIINFMITCVIFGCIGAVLAIVGIGVIILAVIPILQAIFAVLGAIKANNGEYWKYPLTFEFVK